MRRVASNCPILTPPIALANPPSNDTDTQMTDGCFVTLAWSPVSQMSPTSTRVQFPFHPRRTLLDLFFHVSHKLQQQLYARACDLVTQTMLALIRYRGILLHLSDDAQRCIEEGLAKKSPSVSDQERAM